MYWLDNSYEAIARFMVQGGDVLWLIAAITFTMWMLVFERIWYFRTGLKRDVGSAIASWEHRSERKSWNAHQIRRATIADMHSRIYSYLPMIKTLVALCPLCGLLGTVTGMIEVFNIMAVTGGGDAKSMAGGVSRATIPTMAGMVVAISGVFASEYVSRVAKREHTLVQDRLTADH